MKINNIKNCGRSSSQKFIWFQQALFFLASIGSKTGGLPWQHFINNLLDWTRLKPNVNTKPTAVKAMEEIRNARWLTCISSGALALASPRMDSNCHRAIMKLMSETKSATLINSKKNSRASSQLKPPARIASRTKAHMLLCVCFGTCRCSCGRLRRPKLAYVILLQWAEALPRWLECCFDAGKQQPCRNGLYTLCCLSWCWFVRPHHNCQIVRNFKKEFEKSVVMEDALLTYEGRAFGCMEQ